MACDKCVHLHIVNGRIVYARCRMGRAVFERFGEGRILPSEYTCPEEIGAVEARKKQTSVKMKGEGT